MKETRAKEAMRYYLKTGKQLPLDENAPQTSKQAIEIRTEMIDLFKLRYEAEQFGDMEERTKYSDRKIVELLQGQGISVSKFTVNKYYKEFKEVKDELQNEVQVVDDIPDSIDTDFVRSMIARQTEMSTEIDLLKQTIVELVKHVQSNTTTLELTMNKLQLLPAPITTPLAGYSIEQLNVFAQEWLSIMSKQPPIIKSIFLADNEYYNQQNNLFDTLAINMNIPESYGITHIDKDKLELLDTAYTSKTHPESLVLQHFSSMRKFKKYLTRYTEYRQLPFLESRNTQLSCTNEKFQLAFLATKHELGS